MCGIGISIVAFAATATRSWKARVLAAGIVLLLIGTIFLSASRSGLINLVVIAIFFGAYLRIRPFRVAAIGIFVVALLSAVLLLAPPSLIETMAGRQPGVVVELDKHAKTHGGLIEKYLSRITAFTTNDDEVSGAEGSTKARLKLLGVGLRMVADHPLMGVGMGDFRWVSIVDYQNPQYASMHNSYMLTAVEGGFLLLTPYLVLMVVTWMMIRSTRRAALARPDIGLDWLVEATRAMWAIFIVFSVFAEMWHEPYLYLILGFAIVLENLYRPRPAPAVLQGSPVPA
jgi:O-antigen ligase